LLWLDTILNFNLYYFHYIINKLSEGASTSALSVIKVYQNRTNNLQSLTKKWGFLF